MRTRNQDKEQLVKEEALKMLVNEGLEGFSVNKLAKRCGISVATLYIYYKDKDDLILKIAKEEARKMSDAVLGDFDPYASFAVGLKQQWKNRATYMLENPTSAMFFDQLRASVYEKEINDVIVPEFRRVMGLFMQTAIEKGEIDPMPLEVYWSVAFAPLYNLIRFHQRGKSVAGRAFKLTDEVLWKTFDLVLKALLK